LLCAMVSRSTRGMRHGWRNRLIWLSSPEASQSTLVAAAALVMTLSLVLTMSRSGIAACAVSLLIASWWAMRRMPGGWGRIAIAIYGAAVVALIVGLVGVDAIAARFGAANPATVNERLPIWRDAWSIVRDFRVVGTGLNTYGVATLVYQTSMLDL